MKKQNDFEKHVKHVKENIKKNHPSINLSEHTLYPPFSSQDQLDEMEDLCNRLYDIQILLPLYKLYKVDKRLELVKVEKEEIQKRIKEKLNFVLDLLKQGLS